MSEERTRGASFVKRVAKARERTGLAFSLAGLAASVVRRSALRRFPEVSLAERLAMLPDAADVKHPVTLRWNDQHIPFVEAQCERDAAVGLGVVHGHLRLAQMEVMRRAATGRIAEVAGPAAAELDALLRLIDFPRARDASLALCDQATRDWIDGFAAGISAAAATGPTPEFDVFGLSPEPWSAHDLFAVSRLCSADYAWRVWRTLSALRTEPEWAEMWQSLIGTAAAADEDIAISPSNIDTALPTAFAKTGSNACAIAGSRTASGKPMLACDPHLTITTPTIWLIAGFSTPATAVWGMMIPALPIFAPGRNAHGAWGGTNLHATSSELVDVAAEPIASRTVSIPVRGRPDHKAELRESPYGPVISDTKVFNLPGETVALHWMGHRPSDEFAAFRGMMYANTWEAFADAVNAYALPGLTMVWAGTDGQIGKMIGAHLPRRPLAVPGDIVSTTGEVHETWGDLITGHDLPKTVNPPEGYVVSANEAPDDAPITISLFFSADIRAKRLAALIEAETPVTLDALKAMHLDVYLAPAHQIAAHLHAAATEAGCSGRALEALGAWDGCFDAESRGALAFEMVAAPLIAALEAASPQRAVSPSWRPFERLTRLVTGADPETLRDALEDALTSANAALEKAETWGDNHRVRLQHPLARLPWLTGRLATLDYPSPGSNETLHKAMHPVGQARHATPFGANARFVADLSDPDETYAVLLGGQDGWPGSRTLFDQVGAWRRGDSIRLPLRAERRAEAFRHETRLVPRD